MQDQKSRRGLILSLSARFYPIWQRTSEDRRCRVRVRVPPPPVQFQSVQLRLASQCASRAGGEAGVRQLNCLLVQLRGFWLLEVAVIFSHKYNNKRDTSSDYPRPQRQDYEELQVVAAATRALLPCHIEPRACCATLSSEQFVLLAVMIDNNCTIQT